LLQKHQTSEISLKTSDLMLKHQKWQLATLLNARLSREVQCRADCRDEHGTGLDRTEANFAGSVLDRTAFF